MGEPVQMAPERHGASALIVPPYTELASIYDHIMQHVNYKQWARYVVNLLVLAGLKSRNLLEAACGTGTLSILLSKRKFSVTGFDSSDAMLAIAKRKAAEEHAPIEFFRADLTSFEVPIPVSGIICLYDSINYLLEPELVHKFFTSAHAALVQGGILIFDIATEHNSLNNASYLDEQGIIGEISYIRKSYYDPKEKIHYNEFTIKKPEGTFLEHHRERIYSIEELRRLLQLSQFHLLHLFDGFSYKEATVNSDRIHFVARAF